MPKIKKYDYQDFQQNIWARCFILGNTLETFKFQNYYKQRSTRRMKIK